jgi:hypothetical protein
MSRYASLFSLRIEHEFFVDNRCDALSCQADAASEKVAANCELVLKTNPRGAAVYFDEDRTDAMKLATADPSAMPELWFRLSAIDPKFANWTSPTIPRPDFVLFFSNEHHAESAGAGEAAVSLAKTETVSDVDFVNWKKAGESESFGPVLTARDRRVPPVAFIRIVLRDLVPRRYFLRFEARQTYWKYYLLGDIARPSATIVDTLGETEFGLGQETTLADSRRAIAFTSRTKIPLRKHSEKRFQLRENSAGLDRVLIKDLPVASPDRLYKDTINGKEALVSDIYINC